MPPTHGRRVRSPPKGRHIGISQQLHVGISPPWSLQVLAFEHPGAAGIARCDLSCKSASQMGFPDSPWRDGYPRERERAFSHSFRSSLLCWLLCPSGRAAALSRAPAAVCAQHRAAEAGTEPKLTRRLENMCDCTKRGRESSEKIAVLHLGFWKWEVFVYRRVRKPRLEINLFFKWGFAFSGLENAV